MTVKELQRLIRETLQRETAPPAPASRSTRERSRVRSRVGQDSCILATHFIRTTFPFAIWAGRFGHIVTIELPKALGLEWRASSQSPLRHILEWCRAAGLDPQIRDPSRPSVEYDITINITTYRFRG